ncbi:SdpI family protein [Clostridium cylindrosporum]|uniref:SdpI/YhfL protein family n=1 Tax=Clostridium cylindrosporum DSM 605 TaxID=1121307 RepID=A0A0J8D9K4_CLOCY|nr:SdpI family protein [Clostridium cylindrosporum]KMT22730.1 SdpI/YhfL protein family [Clostridium cylindrosporum DSM 605]
MIYIVYLISGIIFIIAGLVLRYFPPKSINGVIGYRTSMAIKNKETWDEAQRYGGNSMIVFGIINFIIAAFTYRIHALSNEVFQIMFLIVGSIVVIIIVEVHMKKMFNKDGSRK